MLPAVQTALKLSWFQGWVIRLAIKQILKRLNKAGAGYFTRPLAFEVRRKIIAEIARQIAWAKAKTPDFEIDEQALQCAAWVLESDTLQRKVNAATGESIDVHQRWSTRQHP